MDPNSDKKNRSHRKLAKGRRARIESLERRELFAADSFLFSLAATGDLISSDGSVLAADDSEFVRLTVQNDGTYNHELFFDGSDVQLSSASAGINGFSILPDGDLLVVTENRFSVWGVRGDDEDVLRFRPTQLGATTRGSWNPYFEGSDVDFGAQRR